MTITNSDWRGVAKKEAQRAKTARVAKPTAAGRDLIRFAIMVRKDDMINLIHVQAEQAARLMLAGHEGSRATHHALLELIELISDGRCAPIFAKLKYSVPAAKAALAATKRI